MLGKSGLVYSLVRSWLENNDRARHGPAVGWKDSPAVDWKHLRSGLEMFPQSAGKFENVNGLFVARCANLKLLGCFTALSSYRKLTVISSILVFGA